MHAGGNPPETRRRETIQADVSGRARVIDGDTIEVSSARIRLFGIDAPESAQRCLAGSRCWPCGEQATRALAGRIDGRTVACEERDRDRYGRVVAVCRSGGQDVNAWLVHEGWAMAYRRYSTAYVREEAAAKAARRGVWRGELVPPWDWRRGDRLETGTRDAPRVAARDRGGCHIKGNISHNSAKRIYHMPAIATTNARASAPRAVSGISALKPKRGRPVGAERAGDRAHRGDGWTEYHRRSRSPASGSFSGAVPSSPEEVVVVWELSSRIR